MVAALVITLREGMEAALVLAIILTYLRRAGRLDLKRYVYFGLGLAILASIAAAGALRIIGFDPENEYLEGALLGIGGLFVATMVLWMWRAGRHLRRHLEARLDAIVTEEKATRGAGMGLLAFTFFMVGREGMETVLFLGAASLGKEANVLDFVGGSLGIGLAVLFATLFIRGSLRVNLGRFFVVTALVLLVLAARLLAGSVHEFAEVGLLPMTGGAMKALGYFVRDRASDLLLMALVMVPIGLLLWDFRRAPAPAAQPGETGAQRRQRLAARRWERGWQMGLLAATVAILLSMASTVLAANPFLDPAPQPASALDGEIRLDTADWQAEELHKFYHPVADAHVRFLAVKLDDGSLVTALDACQICGAVGYMQERGGRNAICKNCNAPIPMKTLGMGGGCNPLPLASRTEGSTLVIPLQGLEGQADRFR